MSLSPSAVRKRTAVPSCLLVALSVGVAGLAHGATLSNMPDRTYVTDGPVNAITRVGDTIYIGGQFQTVGPRTGPGVEVALDGTQNVASPEVSGAGPSLSGGNATGLRAVVSDGAGGWFISGLFTHVGGVARTNVAHILGDDSVDPAFNPVLDGNVEALVLSGTTLYIGGAFGHVGAQVRNNVAALSVSDGSVTGFNPNADAEVQALVISTDGTVVYAGGNGFTNIGGAARTALAALDPITGNAIASFNPVLAMANGAPTVGTLAVSGTTLFAGGNFDSVNGAPLRTIAALDATGNPLSGFAPVPTYSNCAPCATVTALAVSGSTVYLGGSFDTIGGASRNNIAAISASTGVATAFDPDSHSNILSMAAVGNTVYVGGGFQSLGGQDRRYFAAVDATTGAALPFNPGPNGTINAIAVTDSAVYFGGLFSSIGGVPRASLAAIDAATGIPTAWDAAGAGMNGNYAKVSSLLATDSTLYVGGSFVTIGGQDRENLAEIHLSDALATDWNPSSNGAVDSIARSGSVVYAAGAFYLIGGQQRFFIAALDATTGLATSWDPNPDNTVQVITIAADTLYAGGMFLHIGGQERLALGAISLADGTATDWTPNVVGSVFGAYVYDLKIVGPLIYVGGGFASMQGVPRHNAAALSLADATPTAFDPQAGGGSDDGAVFAIAVDGPTVYLGGDFTTVGGQPRGLVAATNAADGAVLDFNPNGSGGNSIYALDVATDGTLYVGGSYPTFDLAYQQGFAAFSPTTSDVIFANGFEGL